MSEESSLWAGIKETVKTVVYALLIAGAFRTILFQPFWIPSGSMKDTLLIGDFLFVNKMAYGYSYASCPAVKVPSLGIDLGPDDFCGAFMGADDRLFGSEPERGDVVVFRHRGKGEDYIKRLIGMPGDRIQVINGHLQINGEPVGLEPAGQFIEVAGPQGPQRLRPQCMDVQGTDCIKDMYIETLPNGVSHHILNVRDGNRVSAAVDTDNTEIYVVPEDHYFFMGDNRDNSIDSRVAWDPVRGSGVGFVRREDIVGRADRVIFSSAGRSILAFWTWRSDRFFKAIE